MKELKPTPQTSVEDADRSAVKDPKRQKSFATNQGVRLHVEREVALATKNVSTQIQAVVRSLTALGEAFGKLSLSSNETKDMFEDFRREMEASLSRLEQRWYNRVAAWLYDKWCAVRDWTSRFIDDILNIQTAPAIPPEVLSREEAPESLPADGHFILTSPEAIRELQDALHEGDVDR